MRSEIFSSQVLSAFLRKEKTFMNLLSFLMIEFYILFGIYLHISMWVGIHDLIAQLLAAMHDVWDVYLHFSVGTRPLFDKNHTSS
jgi:hypothetical protein